MTSPTRRRGRRVAVLAVGVGMLTAACATGSSDNNSGGAATTDGAPTPTEAPAETDAPTPTEAPAATEAPVETEAPTETETPETGAPAATAAPAPTDAPAPPAPQALQFSAPLVGGGTIDPAAEFTGKPTLMWFWAPF
ncbi:MAG: hypothetical protein AAGA42_12695 [Actinomycetota bacterium]